MSCCTKRITERQKTEVQKMRSYLNALHTTNYIKCGFCGGKLQRVASGKLICSTCLKAK
jgi:hypothetical protein